MGLVFNLGGSGGGVKIAITPPALTGSLTYTGNAQSPTLSGFDSNTMVLSGDTSKTNAGNYNLVVNCKEGYCFNDRTTSKTIPWSIAKADCTISFSKSSVALTAVGATDSFTVTRSGDGAITVSSSNSSVVSASASGNVINLTAGSTAGQATITVNVAAGTNHKATSKTLTAKLTLITIPGTVGNTFTMGKYQVGSEAAQDITWEVVHVANGYAYCMPQRIIDLRCFDAKEPSNSDNNRKQYGNNRYACSNIRQWLNSRKTSGWFSTAAETYHVANSVDQAPDTAANCGGYDTGYSSKAGFATCFSDAEWDLIVPVTLTIAKNTVTDGGGSETVTDKVWLPTMYQMQLGANNSINEGDGVQFSKFNSNDARKKQATQQCISNTGASSKPGASDYWYYWLSSPSSGNSNNARTVSSNGQVNHGNAYNGILGVCPCIKLPVS